MMKLTKSQKKGIRIYQLSCLILLVWFMHSESPGALPNVYQAIVVFVEAINPLNINWGADHGTPTDFVQKIINYVN